MTSRGTYRFIDFMIVYEVVSVDIKIYISKFLLKIYRIFEIFRIKKTLQVMQGFFVIELIKINYKP